MVRGRIKEIRDAALAGVTFEYVVWNRRHPEISNDGQSPGSGS